MNTYRVSLLPTACQSPVEQVIQLQDNVVVARDAEGLVCWGTNSRIDRILNTRVADKVLSISKMWFSVSTSQLYFIESMLPSKTHGIKVQVIPFQSLFINNEIQPEQRLAISDVSKLPISLFDVSGKILLQTATNRFKIFDLLANKSWKYEDDIV